MKNPTPFVKLLRSVAFVAVVYGAIIAIMVPGLSDRYVKHGQWLTGLYYGCLLGIVMLVMGVVEAWLKSRTSMAAATVESPEARAKRVLQKSMRHGSDTLDSDDYGFLMDHVAKLGTASQDAQRAHRAAVTAYARSSKDTPIIYTPQPLVKRNELTPVPVAEDLEHRLAS